MASSVMALDVGEKRIGIAMADTDVKIAIPYGFIEVDSTEVAEINNLIISENIKVLVIGMPRNSNGEETRQSAYVRGFAKKLELSGPEIVFQDESLTSVLAEKRLISFGKPYSKGDIDAQAATMILQDYLEANY